MMLEDAKHPSRRKIPNPGGTVIARGQQEEFARRRKYRAVDLSCVLPRQLKFAVAGFCVPNLDPMIRAAAGNELSVWREISRRHAAMRLIHSLGSFRAV